MKGLSKKAALRAALAATVSFSSILWAGTASAAEAPNGQTVTDKFYNVNSYLEGETVTYTDKAIDNNKVDNEGPYGGAIWANNKTNLTLTGGSLSGNQNISTSQTKTTDDSMTAYGGAIMLKGSSLTLNNVEVKNNTATGNNTLAIGGAIFADAIQNKNTPNQESTVTVNVTGGKNLEYTGNKATGIDGPSDTYGNIAQKSAGGFLYLDRNSKATFNIEDGSTLKIGDGTDSQDEIASSYAGSEGNKSSVTKTGDGTMTVNSSLNDLHSDVTVEDGTLDVTKDWTTSNAVTVNDGATLKMKNFTLTEGPATVGGKAVLKTAGDLEAESGSTVTAKDVTANDGTTINAAQGSNFTADKVKVGKKANVRLLGNANVTNLTDTDGNALTQDEVNTILGNDRVPDSVKFGTDEKTKAQLTADGTKMSAQFQTADAANGSITNKEVATLDKKGNLTTIGDITDGKGNKLSDVKAATETNAKAITDEATRAKAAETANKDAIDANKQAIQTNASGIAANKTATETNAAAIKTNADGIAANKAATEKNAADIQTNAAGIAANKSDIADLQNSASNNTAEIADLRSDVNDVRGRINKVGAGAAALANLHPLDYDGTTPWNVAAAVGNYRNETASAIGVFYRPNDDVMYNVSGTIGIGSNETMIGAGVSVKFGPRSPKRQEVKDSAIRDLQEQLQRQQKQIEEQQKLIEELMAKVK